MNAANRSALVLALSRQAVAAPSPGPPAGVALEGPPGVIGAEWGRVNAASIKDDMRRNFIEPAAAKGLSEPDLLERGRRFVEICAEVAPHWLEEADAIAAAAGVDAEIYRAYIGCVYRSLWAGDECTSYAVSPEYTDGALFFHKNRDNVARPQAACVVASSLPGVNRFITVSDASVLACMMMVNDKGLAGSGDTGGLAPPAPRYRGIMNTFILRHIAERAATCAEAEAIVRDFVGKGYYAGGATTGTHWLFTDRHGAILEISNNASEVVARRHTDKTYFSLRGDSAAAHTLRDAPPPIDFHTYHNVSRDPSMCFDSTISGMTVEIHPAHPEHLSCAWLTFPGKGLAFPLLMGCRTTPLPLMSGEVYALLSPIDGAAPTWEAVERNSHANKELLAWRAAALLEDGAADRAHALLDDWVLSTTQAQTAMLRAMQPAGVPAGPPTFKL